MTVLFCGIGLIAAGFAVIVAREVAGGIVVDQLVTTKASSRRRNETWSIATSLMTSIATTVIVVGVLFGIAGWLASPTGSAKATRRYLAPALREYPAYVYSGLAVIVGIYFLSAPTQNLRSFLTTLAIAGLTAFGIHELRRQAHEEYPDASYDEHLRHRPGTGSSDAVKSANLGERASKLKLPEVRRPEGDGDRGAGGEPAGMPRTPASSASSASAPCTRRAFSATRSWPPRRPACSNSADDACAGEIEVPRAWRSGRCVGVCALSAAIGSSITLLAETGPPGKQGERGARGPRGPEGPEGTVEAPDFGFLESEIEDLAQGTGRPRARPKAGSKNSKKT